MFEDRAAAGADPIKRLHPCSVLTIKQLSQSFPSKLSFEPLDSLQLFRAMQGSLHAPLDATWKETATATLNDLAPAVYLPAGQVLMRRPFITLCDGPQAFQTACHIISVSLS